jgi:hypothetical protein
MHAEEHDMTEILELGGFAMLRQVTMFGIDQVLERPGPLSGC